MKRLFILSIFCFSVVACGRMNDTIVQDNPVYRHGSPEERTWRKVCSSCHSIADANPRGYPAAQWPRVVDKMQNKKGGNQFTDKEKALILKYLIAGASN